MPLDRTASVLQFLLAFAIGALGGCLAVLSNRGANQITWEGYDAPHAEVSDESQPDGGELAIAPYDRRLHSSFFYLRNPLGLFYPYRTSADDMNITHAMQARFDSGEQGTLTEGPETRGQAHGVPK